MRKRGIDLLAAAFLLCAPTGVEAQGGVQIASVTAAGSAGLVVEAGGSPLGVQLAGTGLESLQAGFAVLDGEPQPSVRVTLQAVLPSRTGGASRRGVTISAGADAPPSGAYLLRLTVAGTKRSVDAATFRVVAAVPPALRDLAVEPRDVTAGSSARGTVTLDRAAPLGGTAVRLSSGRPALASVPREVRVPAGKSQASFRVSTDDAGLPAAEPASSAESVTLGAVLGTAKKTAALTVRAPPAVAGQGDTPVLAGGAGPGTTGVVESVQLEPSPVTAGDAVTVRVTLSSLSLLAMARTVELTHRVLTPAPGLAAPIQLVLAAGENTAVGELYVAPAVASPTIATVTASFNGTTRTATVTIQPLP